MADKRPYRKDVQGEKMPQYDFSKIPRKRRQTSGQTNRSMSQRENPSTSKQDHQDTLEEQIEYTGGTEFITLDVDMGAISDDQQDLIYCIELRKSGSVASVDQRGMFYVLQDFSTATKSLHPFRIIVVKRKCMKFGDEYQWLYSCSCNKKMMELIGSLPFAIPESFTDFCELHPPCLHIRALCYFLDGRIERDMSPELSLTDHEYTGTTGVSKELTQEVPFGNLLACVIVDGDVGVVTVDKCQLTCRTCEYGVHSCIHVRHIEHLIEDTDGDVPEIVDNLSFALTFGVLGKEAALAPLSSEAIAFSPEGRLKPVSLEPDGTCVLTVPLNECTICDSILASEPMACLLFVRNEIYQTRVIQKTCPSCLAKYDYDGKDDYILNMGKFLIHHEVLRDYMYHFLHARCTMHTYYTIWSLHMSDMGHRGFKKELSYRQFRWSWYGYRQLLDIDYAAGFTCPTCVNHPDLIICDATALAHRKIYMQKKHEESTSQKKIMPNSKYEDRLFVGKKALRKLISRFASAKPEDHLLANEFDDMLSQVTKTVPALTPLVTYCQTIGSSSSAPEELRPLLLMLASSSPVSGTIFLSSFQILQQLRDDHTLANSLHAMECLQKEVPLLFDLLRVDNTVPDYLDTIIDELIKASKVPYPSEQSEPISSASEESTDQRLSDEQHGGQTQPDAGDFFPSLRMIRERGNYMLDKAIDEDVCNKKGTRHPSLLPGVFVMFCGHGVCLGFELMNRVESPNVPFSVLFTRFERAPNVVVYDNACNLHSYCLNRQPDFFKVTRFLIDRLHWKNHKCAIGYNLDKYPQFNHINSQVVEQCNASIGKLKSSLSYMNHSNFMNSLKFYLWYRNHMRT